MARAISPAHIVWRERGRTVGRVALALRQECPLGVHSVDDPEWLRFLESQPAATLFHNPAWSRVLGETYGYRPAVLAQHGAYRQIVAGLPMLQVTHSPPRFEALPFTDHCPPLAATKDDLARFGAELARWRDQHGVRQLAIHGMLPAHTGAHFLTRAVRHVLPLTDDGQPVHKRLERAQVGRAVRKARRAGLASSIVASGAALEPFYRLHLRTRRRLGVPIQPRRFFDNLWKYVIEAGLGIVVFAYHQDKPVAAALFLAWNGNLIFKFGASDPHHWSLRPNNLVMWTAIEWACQRGYRLLDLGRTDLDNHGLRDFKKRWGSVEVPLTYTYLADAPPVVVPLLARRGLAKIIQYSPLVVCRAAGELLYRRAGSLA